MVSYNRGQLERYGGASPSIQEMLRRGKTVGKLLYLTEADMRAVALKCGGRRAWAKLWLRAISAAAKGVIGSAKVMLSWDQASARMIRKRLAVCLKCDHHAPCRKGSQAMCCGKFMSFVRGGTSQCGCRTASMVRLKTKHCPIGAW